MGALRYLMPALVADVPRAAIVGHERAYLAACLATDGGVNPDVLAQLSAAGALPGIPVEVQLPNSKAVVLIREWDDLTQQEQVTVLPSVQTQVAAEVNARIQGADVFVDSRFGRWDAATGTVVPFSAK